MLGSTLKKALEKHAYGVDWMQDGESALLALKDNSYAVVVLDVNLPKMSGIDVLKAVRHQKNSIPIMLLTARDMTLHKVEGLDSGADDYMVKPFDLDELLARLRALVRRREGRVETVLVCGDVEIDPAAKVVRKGVEQVTMTAKEFQVLKLLMGRAGKYVTKNDMEYAVYSADNAVESNTIEVTIYNLRKKLGSGFIKSVRGVGYRVEA